MLLSEGDINTEKAPAPAPLLLKLGTVLTLLFAPTASLLLPAHGVQRVLRAPPRPMTATMQEESPADAPVESKPVDEALKAKQLEVAAGASDPFRLIRQVVYAVFSVVGV